MDDIISQKHTFRALELVNSSAVPLSIKPLCDDILIVMMYLYSIDKKTVLRTTVIVFTLLVLLYLRRTTCTE